MSSTEYSRVEILAGSIDHNHNHHNNHHENHHHHHQNGQTHPESLTTHPGFVNLCFENSIDNDELCIPNNVPEQNNLKKLSNCSQQIDTETISDHCHDESFDKNRENQTKSAIIKLTSGFVLCLIFMLIELIGGYLSHSLAIFAGKFLALF